jgi:hypothetical protein
MRRRGAQKTVGITSAAVAVVLAGTVVWLLNAPPTADCAAEAPADRRVHEIRATKVRVQPWLGEHQVYGIFTVPNRYRHNRRYVVTMSVRGFDGHFRPSARSYKQSVEGVFAEPEHYLLRGYVPTRVALWFLVNGLFGDLQRPCNWALVFVERSS